LNTIKKMKSLLKYACLIAIIPILIGHGAGNIKVLDNAADKILDVTEGKDHAYYIVMKQFLT